MKLASPQYAQKLEHEATFETFQLDKSCVNESALPNIEVMSITFTVEVKSSVELKLEAAANI